MSEITAGIDPDDIQLLRDGFRVLSSVEGYRRAFGHLMGFVDGTLDEAFMLEYFEDFLRDTRLSLDDIALLFDDHNLHISTPGGFKRPLQIHNALLALLRATAVRQHYYLPDESFE